jgi:hypothetical protein
MEITDEYVITGYLDEGLNSAKKIDRVAIEDADLRPAAAP